MNALRAPRDLPRGGLRIAMALYGDVTYDSRVHARSRDPLDGGARGHHLLPHGLACGRASRSASSPTAAGSLGLARREQPVPPSAPGRRSSRGSSNASAGSSATRERSEPGVCWAVAAAGTVDVWHAARPDRPVGGRPARADALPARLRQPRDLPGDRDWREAPAAAPPDRCRRTRAAWRAAPSRSSRSTRATRWSSGSGSGPHARSSFATALRAGPHRSSHLRDSARPRGYPRRSHSSCITACFSAQPRHRGARRGDARARASSRRTWCSWATVRAGPALEELARDPRFGGRIHVLDAVPPGELLDLGRGRRRECHRAPAVDAEPLALHPQQALGEPRRRQFRWWSATSR